MDRIDIKGTRLESEGTALFEDGVALQPSIRRLKELSNVLLKKGFVNERNAEDPLYYVYRGAGLSKSPRFEEQRLRYDITVLERYDLGGECNKTLGHYHSIAEKGMSYPEIYEVLQGEVLYVLQKKLPDSRMDVRLVRVPAGRRIVFPPNYGHISVNISDGISISGNLVSMDYKADYDSIIKMGGGAVYVLSDKTAVPNGAYPGVSVPEMEDAPKEDFLGRGSVYDQFLDDPSRFEFLNRPSLLFKA